MGGQRFPAAARGRDPDRAAPRGDGRGVPGPAVFGFCGTVRVEDLTQVSARPTRSSRDERNGRIHRLVEKPRTPLNNIQGTGNCVFRNGMFGYIAHTPINQHRQEKELPDLIQCTIDDGKLVRAFEFGRGTRT